jgi:hypothetical protein
MIIDTFNGTQKDEIELQFFIILNGIFDILVREKMMFFKGFNEVL